MEDKKRTVMAVIIIVVVLAAVLYSFFLNLFSPTPHLELPDPNASQSMDPVGEESGWPEGATAGRWRWSISPWGSLWER